MKTYLFMMSHPAHYHLFKHPMARLKAQGHRVVPVIRPKDVLEQLCRHDGLDVVKVKARPAKGGLLRLGFSLVARGAEVYRLAGRFKPDLLIGTDGCLALVGFLRRLPALACNEDDAEAVPLYARLFYPFFTRLIVPDCCSVGKWEKKKVGYPGYHELAYLHPRHFTPSAAVAAKYVAIEQPYFLLRFARLNAYHDGHNHGLSPSMTQKLLGLLQPHGRVFISSERELEPQFEPYRLHIDPADLHHVLAFASLYLGDSQTMAAEAAVLGVPFVRFNDFVGRLTYLNQLERVYQLGSGHRTDDVEGFYRSVQSWLDSPERKEICALRRQRMLAEKIDPAAFLTDYFAHYAVDHTA